jgi:hypothetical protein
VKLAAAVGGTLAAAMLVLAGCGGDTNDAERTQGGSTARNDDRSYSGVGSQVIGTLNLPAGADATWTSTGGLFMLIAVNAPASAQLIVSREPAGTEFVPGGSYVLKVGTLPTSRWTLTFRERPHRRWPAPPVGAGWFGAAQSSRASVSTFRAISSRIRRTSSSGSPFGSSSCQPT